MRTAWKEGETRPDWGMFPPDWGHAFVSCPLSTPAWSSGRYSVSFKLPVQSRLVNIVTVESRISDDFTAKLMISVQSHPDRARKITSLYVVTQDHKSYQRLRPQTTAGGAVGQSRPRVGWLGPPVPPVTLVLPSIKISISKLSVYPARFSGLADGDDADLQLISFGIYLQISGCGANLS